jgi:predicted esterase
MSTGLAMKQFEQEFYRLCGDGDYAAAYALVTREMGRFPAWAQSSYYNWRMCSACLIGEPDLALRIFEEALAAGHWYDEAGLREDADLATLQGRSEFERLVAISLGRREAALASAKPELKVFEPAEVVAPLPLLIALHGNQSNLAESAERWQPATERGWLVAAPQSSQPMGPGVFGWNDREWAVREVERHYAALREQYAIDHERVVVAGFSMGGGLAIWLALSGALPARGFVGVGAFLPTIESIAQLLEAGGGRGKRAYLVASQRDVACYEIARTLAQLLPRNGVPCELELHPDLGHDFPPEFERGLLTALEFLTRG